MPESLQPMELVYGRVREPPSPRYGHQSVVTHLAALLDQHVRQHDLGKVCVSPMDVVLDDAAALVVQPDIVFVATPHLDRIRERIWGAPDLVVEVLSRGTAKRDRTTKSSTCRASRRSGFGTGAICPSNRASCRNGVCRRRRSSPDTDLALNPRLWETSGRQRRT
jgi:Uma2 family endonuclease